MLKSIVAAGAMLAFLAACGQAGGDTPQPTPTQQAAAAQTPVATPTAEPTPTASEAPGGAGLGEPEGTVIPVTPFPPTDPVPEDWATYTDFRGRFAMRYPPTWELDTSGEQPPADVEVVGDSSVVSFFSYGRSAWTKPYFPPNSMKVEVYAVSLDADVPTCQPEGPSSPRLLGGVPGSEVLTVYDTAVDYPGLPDESKLSRSHLVTTDHNGYRFCLVALCAGMDPDETTFLQVVDSFTFTER